MTVPDRLRARAARDPDAVALVVDRQPLTFRQWDRRSSVVADGLAARAIGSGDRVALLFDSHRWAHAAVAYVGVLRAGAVAVPLAPGLPDVDRDRMLADCQPALVVGPADLTPATGAWPACSLQQLEAAPATGRPEPDLDPDGAAEILYPQGVMRAPARSTSTHERLLAAGPSLSDVTAGAFVHGFAPGTPAGQEALRLPLVAEGVTAVAAPVFEPVRFRGLVADAAKLGTVSCGLTPAMARALEAAPADSVDLSGVQRVIVPPSVDGRSVVNAGADVAPLVAAQDGMVWHEQFTPGSFNLAPAVRRYRGRLDVVALEEALNEIVRRHAALRTTFSIHDGRGIQVFTPFRSRRLTVVDLSRLPAGEQRGRLAGLVADARRRPFDLVTGPLFDPTLVRLGPDDHVMVIRSHHAVYDDWSVGLFRRELSALYSAFVASQAAPLPELPVGLPEVARRQAAERRGPAGRAEREFWRGELEQAPLSVQLPIDDPARPAGSPHSAPPPLSMVLSPALSEALRRLARRQRATPFTVLLAAFAVLTERYTGQNDVLVSTLAANRPTTDVENLIGCFGKKVLVRLRLSDDPWFGDLVTRTRRAVMGALAHQAPAYEAVVQETLGRDAAAHGLAPQVALKFQAAVTSTAKLALAGLTTGGVDLPRPTERAAHFLADDDPPGDAPQWGGGLYLGVFLGISVVESDEGIRLVTEGVFHPPEVERLLAHFHVLLADIAANPDRQVSELRVVEADQEQPGARPPSNTGTPSETTVDAAVAAQAERDPDRVAVVCDNQSVAFAELDRHAGAAASELHRAGLGREVRLSSIGGSPVDLVVGALAAWKTGRTVAECPAPRGRLTAAGAAIQAAAFGPDGEQRRVCVPPSPGSSAFVRGLLALAAGHTVHISGRSAADDPEAWVSLLARGLVDVVDCEAPELELLLTAGLQPALYERTELSAPRPVVLVSVDGPIAPETWAEWRGIKGADVWVLYGPPACGFGATMGRVSGGAARSSIGHPLPGISAAVVDALGRPVPLRALGTLVLGGPSAARPSQGGVLDTGRQARSLPDGTIELAGGAGDVDLRGFRVQPERIEAALAGCPGVGAVKVVADRTEPSPGAVSPALWGRSGPVSPTLRGRSGPVRLVAHVVPRGSSAPPTLHSLRRWLWARLPGYAWPAAMAIVDALPASGGLDGGHTGDRLPPDAVFLASAWAEAHGPSGPIERESQGTNDNYWQSFAFLDVLAELAEAGHHVPARHATRNRTLEALATDLAARRAGAVRGRTTKLERVSGE